MATMSRRLQWNDTTLLQWGIHRGKPLGEVPPAYLLWLYEQRWIKDWPPLHKYLQGRHAELVEIRESTIDKAGLQASDDGFTSYEDYKAYRG